jgi:ribosomal protein S12 methylthiotransferase
MPEVVDITTQSDAGDADEIRTVSFVSLGCPKNTVDSEKMLGLLAEDGIAPVSAEASGNEHDDLSVAGSEQDTSASEGRVTPADAVVVNTCGFLEASKDESLAVVREAVERKNRGEIKRVVVAGCLVQRHRAKILDWVPGVDAMLGVFDREKVIDAVRGPKAVRESLADAVEAGPNYWISANGLAKAKTLGNDTTGLTVNGKDGKGIGYFESDSARLRLTPRHYAYLRIGEGCNQNCAFCTIPSIRGKMRSKPLDRIEEEARELVRDGAFELLLIGQDTTSYGDDIGTGLASGKGLPELLTRVCNAVTQEGGAGWVRLMYAYPTNFDDRIIDTFAELSQKGCLLPYLDIPLQHGSSRVLELMRRNVTREQQQELCEKMRERIPGMAIRTTFITGFPGETEADHQELLEFIEAVGFDAVGCFRYSNEPGTRAGTMDDDPSLRVPDEVKERRYAEIMALQQQIAFEQAEFVAEQFDPADPDETGSRFDVLIDEPAGETEGGGRLYRGRTYFQAPQIDATTFVESRREPRPGELVRCTIVGADGYDLVARPSEELERRVSLPLA